MSRLLRGILRRPVAVLVASLAVLVVGVISFLHVPIQMFPDGFEERNLSVEAWLREASPEEAERHVAIPLEESLGTVPGILTMSTACSPSRVEIALKLARDADPGLVEREVRDRVARVQPDLPDDVTRVNVRRFGPQDMPVVWFSVSGDVDRLELSDFMEEVVLPRLEALEGVARASARGLVKRTVRIWLDKEEVARRRIDLRELLGRLRGDNVSTDVGSVSEGGRKVFLRATMEFASLDELRAFPVEAGLTLGQIATILVEPILDQGWGRFNGNAVIGGSVHKTSGSNSVDTCARVRALFADLTANHPRARGLVIRPFFDQGREIENALGTLIDNSWQGGLLAMGVLYAFFRRMRMTLLVAAAIPLSLTMAVTLLYLGGSSLNMITMMGLTLAVGMLIDNAIVVVESILRRREAGDAPPEAAGRGTGEVALAVVTSTLTTLVVFLPVIFLTDDANARLLMGSLGGPIAFALLASLAVALVLIPLGSIHLRRRAEGPPPPSPELGPAGRGFRGAFGRVLGRALRNRFAVVVLALVFLASASIPFTRARRQQSMGHGGSAVRVSLRFPRHYSMADADAAMRLYETHVSNLREALELEGIYAHFDKRSAFLMAWKRRRAQASLDEIREAVRKDWPRVPGVRTSLEAMSLEEKTTVTLEGEDPVALEATMAAMRARLERLPSVAEVVGAEADGTQELRVSVDRDALDRMEVDVDAVRATVGWILRGASLRDYTGEGRSLPLIVELDPEQAGDVADLAQVLVPTRRGMVPLPSVTTAEVRRAPISLTREDGRRVGGVTVTGRPGDARAFHAAVQAAVAAVPMPPGVRFRVGGAWNELQSTFRNLADAAILSIVLVFLLTGVLFEALLLPLAVLFAIPPAFAGSVWALHLLDKPIDELAYLGFILLAGVVVNNGIVLVDRVQQLRRAGMPLRAAVVAAGRDRLRPVLMTSLTTMVGLLPMALGGGGGEGIQYDTLATAVIGGLAASTVMTLFLVPVAFTLFHNLSLSLRRAMQRRRVR